MSDRPRPKPFFYFVMTLVICGLLAYGFRDTLFPTAGDTGPAMISQDEINTAAGVEAADANVPTTVKEYKFLPSDKLPPITQTSSYEPMVNRTVKFALNVWAGWAPIILQNEGGLAGKEWKTPLGRAVQGGVGPDR